MSQSHFLAEARDVEHAKTVLVDLMHNSTKPLIVVRGDTATNSAVEKLKKYARLLYYITPIERGFIVHGKRHLTITDVYKLVETHKN